MEVSNWSSAGCDISSGKEKQININQFAGLSRNWVDGKHLFVRFWGPLLMGRGGGGKHKKNPTQNPRGNPAKMLFVCFFVCLFFGSQFSGDFKSLAIRITFVAVRIRSATYCKLKALVTNQRWRNPCELKMGVASSICAIRIKHVLTVNCGTTLRTESDSLCVCHPTPLHPICTVQISGVFE